MRKLKAAVAAALLAIVSVGGAKIWVKKHASEMRAADFYIKSKTIKLTDEGGLCSGVQIRTEAGKDFVLSAAHCRGLVKDGYVTAETEDKQIVKLKFIAEDEKSDLMLLEGVVNMKGLPVAPSAEMGEHIRTFTHGSRLETWKSEGHLIQEKQIRVALNSLEKEQCVSPKLEWVSVFIFELCLMTTIDMVSDAKVTPGSSGGMVVNDSGQLVGIVSAADNNGWAYFVRTIDIQDFIKRAAI